MSKAGLAGADEVLHIVVRGVVQGVGFRHFTRQQAQRLGVAGWVRNLPGGEVELLARVNAENRAEFLAALRRGPAYSQVSGLEVRPAAGEMECPASGFQVRL